MSVEGIGAAVSGGIQRIRPPQGPQHEAPARSFGQTMAGLVNDVNEAQVEADAALRDFAEGKTDSLHEVMLAMAKADLSFKFLMQTRNKLVEAYKEVMRMQV